MWAGDRRGQCDVAESEREALFPIVGLYRRKSFERCRYQPAPVRRLNIGPLYGRIKGHIHEGMQGFRAALIEPCSALATFPGKFAIRRRAAASRYPPPGGNATYRVELHTPSVDRKCFDAARAFDGKTVYRQEVGTRMINGERWPR